MMELLQFLEQLDTQLFLAINGQHSVFWDHFMMIYSQRFVWIPFYLAFIYVMFRNFPPKVNVTCIIVCTIIIAICDQTASALLKPLVERLRPSNPANPISPLVHIVDGYRGGRYGFPSSHAANAWSMALFARYLVRRSKLTCFLALWAFLMSYSRIYLGVHYVGDILVGMFVGFLTASLSYYIFQRVRGNYTHIFKPSVVELRDAHIPFTIGTATIAVILVASTVLYFTGNHVGNGF